MPTVIPIFFANIKESTSTPSIAPPKRIVKPLPIPDIIPPNTAAKSFSFLVIGEPSEKSIPKQFWNKNENNENIAIAYME